jgi:hypothetical protein
MVSKLSPSATSTSPIMSRRNVRAVGDLFLRCYSVFNTEQCELPPSIPEELALPEERMIDPMEA